jgi:hypothetical protein
MKVPSKSGGCSNLTKPTIFECALLGKELYRYNVAIKKMERVAFVNAANVTLSANTKLTAEEGKLHLLDDGEILCHDVNTSTLVKLDGSVLMSDINWKDVTVGVTTGKFYLTSRVKDGLIVATLDQQLLTERPYSDPSTILFVLLSTFASLYSHLTRTTSIRLNTRT